MKRKSKLNSQFTNASFNNDGICFNPLNKKKCHKNIFVKLTNHESSSITCNYCVKIGHSSTYCPIKRTAQSALQT